MSKDVGRKTKGVVGRKCGMTRIFTEAGESIGVTVIHVEPNRVVQVKTPETDGYSAVKITLGSKKASRLNRPEKGEYAKAGVEAGRGMWEFRLTENDTAPQVGEELLVDMFTVGERVDVAGVSKGKGFAGAVKRWNFRTQDATHGNSLSHRAPGSIGQNQSPGRVFKGKKMAGQMGNKSMTERALKVIRVDVERNLLIVEGGVPGPTGADVIIRPTVKG